MEWIKFTDYMPEDFQYVKVKSNDLWHGEGIFQDGKFCYSWVKGACFGKATHWMPLPHPPNEKEKFCEECKNELIACVCLSQGD